MADKKIRRLISIFIILSLFFAGMYVIADPAEDFFASAGLTGNISESLAPVHSDTYNDAIGTTELPAIHSMELQARSVYQQQYREVHESLSLPCLGIDSVSKRKFHRNHTATYLFCQTQNERMTESVYQSDGKKRI